MDSFSHGPVCLHAALTEQEREDIREATEALFAKLTEPISSTEEFVEAIVAEADARDRRRQMLVVKTCPHCGGVVT